VTEQQVSGWALGAIAFAATLMTTMSDLADLGADPPRRETT
jgi:hypothetical protein